MFFFSFKLEHQHGTIGEGSKLKIALDPVFRLSILGSCPRTVAIVSGSMS